MKKREKRRKKKSFFSRIADLFSRKTTWRSLKGKLRVEGAKGYLEDVYLVRDRAIHVRDHGSWHGQRPQWVG